MGPFSCVMFVATFLSLSLLTSPAKGQLEPQVLLVTQPELNYYVTQDQAANLTCEALGATSIDFICMGSPVLPRALTTFQSYDEAHGTTLVRTTLSVSWAEVEGALGAGAEEYWCHCTAQDEDRYMSVSSSRAVVSPAFLDETFEESPASQTVAPGSQTVLTCIPPFGDPVPEVTWRKDGHKVKVGADDNVVIGNEDGTLTILSTRAEDAGIYHCVARNLVGRRQSSPATLVVQGILEEQEKQQPTTKPLKDEPKPRASREVEEPVFREQPVEKMYITPYKPAVLACAVDGAARMTVRCNNQRIEPSRLVSQTDRQTKYIRHELQLSFAEVQNFINSFYEKMYKCECVAWYTDPSLPRQWGSVLSKTGKIFLSFLNNDFKLQPEDVTAQVGTSATLMCGAPEGDPTPEVHWAFEGIRLDPESDGRYTVSEEGYLTISGVDYSDEGRYHCEAENPMGVRQSSSARLTVSDEPVVEAMTPSTPAPESEDRRGAGRRGEEQYEPTFPPMIPESPVFTRNLEQYYFLDQAGNAGKAALVCTVVSADMLTYRCLNNRLKENEQVIDMKTDRASGKRLLTTTTIITGKEVTPMVEQGRNYTCQCVAWFIEDSAWHHIFSNMAVVLPPYIDSVFIYEPSGGLFYAGDSAELACSPPGGQPTPQVSWVKDGQRLDPETDDNLEVLPDGVLIIDRVRAQDAGEYVCVAFNAAGSRSSKAAVLEVYPLPDQTTSTVAAPAPDSPATPDLVVTTTTTTTTTTDSPYRSSSTATEQLPLLSTTRTGRIIPFFVLDPVEEAYVIGQEDATLTCGAMEATRLIFMCNRRRLSVDKEVDAFKVVDPGTSYTYQEKSVAISLSDLQQFQGPGDFVCHCRAYYPGEGNENWQFVAAPNTTVRLASIDRQFEQEPVAQTVGLGISTELVCRPPVGVPKPTIYWVKDGFKVQETNNVRVTAMGSLVFESVSRDDTGNYTCVAENIMGRVDSNTVPMTVVADGTPTAESTAEPESEGEKKPEVDEGDGEAEAEGEAEGEAEAEVREPKFLSIPEATSYIIRSRPVTITCQAVNVEQINFNCNSESIPQSRVQYQDLEWPGEGYDDVMTASIDISREEVENHNDQHGGNDFHCQCYGRYSVPGLSDPQYITSVAGYVEVAFLKKMFPREPFNITVEAGEYQQLPCEAPQGNPPPEVYWTLNGERVESSEPTSDNAFIISKASAKDAGTYVCVASNVANTRKSRPGTVDINVDGEIITGQQMTEAPEPGAEPGSTTPDYDMSWTTEESPQQKCMQILRSCSALMPSSVPTPDSRGCQSAPRYIQCVERFQTECEGVMSAETLEAAEDAKKVVESSCGGGGGSGPSGGVCQELLDCQLEYSKQNVPNADAESMPMEILCEGIHSFLRCADAAAEKCNIPEDSPDTSLTDLAEWFEEYCQKVVDKDWAKSCPSLSQCDLPIEQTTILNNLVQASLWCPYVQETMECTWQAVSDCGVQDVQQDLNYLDTLATNTCSPSAEPDAEGGDKDDSDAEGEAEGGVDDSVGRSEAEGGDDAGGNAWRARASVLLTSLFPVMLVALMSWR
ncbi:uncharacterized protein LOC143301237 [Babylonia areolata]|uniref:uncharacterized protein LOC143301237 n=1 Tax=Babylonia areolata TaxID=304850 RepID=UPI003FD2DC2E